MKGNQSLDLCIRYLLYIPTARHMEKSVPKTRDRAIRALKSASWERAFYQNKGRKRLKLRRPGSKSIAKIDSWSSSSDPEARQEVLR